MAITISRPPAAARPVAPGDNQKVEQTGKTIPFRALFGRRFATNTLANIFTVANFPGTGLDLAYHASIQDDAGNTIYNNLILNGSKPKFTFYPEAIGLHISDPGDERIKSWLIENSRVEIKVGSSEIMKEPSLVLPPGVGVVRQVADQTSGRTVYSESHGIPSPTATGLMRLADGITFPKDKQIEARLFLDSTTLTALAALSGSVPAPGLFLGIVAYGRIISPQGLSLS